MPSSAVRTFTDPYDYASAIRATRAELTVMGRGHFTAKLTRIDLHRLHTAAGRIAEETPEIIANPDAARGLEQALIEAMIGCLGEGEVGEDSAAQRQHELIMRRFRRVVEEHPDRSLHIPEICAAI